MKIEEVEETPLKENNVIIPRIKKRTKKSTLVIEPLSEMTVAEENENNLACPACGKVLKNKGNLNVHIRTIHNGEARKVLWKCKI